MSSPLIGITAGRRTSRGGYPLMTLVEAYVQAVLRSGGSPVILPLGIPQTTLNDTLARLDGILFSGGGDIHPDRYKSEMHPLVSEVDRDRDQVEIDAFHLALELGLPFLGICRGLQLVNVALGGSLYEDIEDQYSREILHRCWPGWPRNHIAHSVEVSGGSRLEQVLGSPSAQVNSLHHQGIRDLAPGLEICAQAPDGVIEGVILKDYPFGLAVQWHPEWLQEDPAMVRLFAAFVDAARDGR